MALYIIIIYVVVLLLFYYYYFFLYRTPGVSKMVRYTCTRIYIRLAGRDRQERINFLIRSLLRISGFVLIIDPPFRSEKIGGLSLSLSRFLSLHLSKIKVGFRPDAFSYY